MCSLQILHCSLEICPPERPNLSEDKQTISVLSMYWINCINVRFLRLALSQHHSLTLQCTTVQYTHASRHSLTSLIQNTDIPKFTACTYIVQCTLQCSTWTAATRKHPTKTGEWAQKSTCIIQINEEEKAVRSKERQREKQQKKRTRMEIGAFTN